MHETNTTSEKVKLLFQILLPVLIYQLANFSAQFIDTIMTGQYGTLELAGVSIAGNVWSPFFTLINGIISGLVPIIGQLFGKKDQHEISKTMHQYFYIALFLALILFSIGLIFLKPVLNWMKLEVTVEQVAVSYLSYIALGIIPLLLFSVIRSFIDALGLTKLSMFLMLLLVPFNIGFNYSFIYGRFGFPEMGGAGAGLGTALSYWCVCLVAIALLYYHPTLKKYNVLAVAPIDLKRWKEPFQVGLPIGLQIFAEVAVFALVGLLMSRFDANVIASYQAAMSFAMLAYAFPMSMSNALAIIVSFEVGRNHYRSAKTFTRLGILTSLTFACGTLLFLLFNREAIAHLYGNSSEFVLLTVTFLSYSLLFQLFDAVAAPIQGVLRGYKDTTVPFFCMIIGFWLFGMPIGFVFDHLLKMGPASYWFALIAGLGSSCCLLFMRLIKMNQRYQKRTEQEMNY